MVDRTRQGQETRFWQELFNSNSVVRVCWQFWVEGFWRKPIKACVKWFSTHQLSFSSLQASFFSIEMHILVYLIVDLQYFCSERLMDSWRGRIWSNRGCNTYTCIWGIYSHRHIAFAYHLKNVSWNVFCVPPFNNYISLPVHRFWKCLYFWQKITVTICCFNCYSASLQWCWHINKCEQPFGGYMFPSTCGKINTCQSYENTS